MHELPPGGADVKKGGFVGAVSGDGQTGKLAGALEGRLSGTQGAQEPQEPNPSALPDPSAEYHTPPKSRRLAPSRCDSPIPSNPAESPQLRTPTSDLQFGAAEQRLLAPLERSGGVSSPARLLTTPPKLSPKQRQAAEAHGELLTRGGVPFLLQELQLIVELLTTNQTSCGGKHEGQIGQAHGEVTGTAGVSESLANGESGGTEAEGEGNGASTLPVGVRSKREVAQSLERGALEKPATRIKEGAGSGGTSERGALKGPAERLEVEGRRKAGELGYGQQKAEAGTVSGPLVALGQLPGSSSSLEGKERPASTAETAAFLEASLPRGVLSFCCGDMAAAYACTVLEASLPLILHCKQTPILAKTVCVCIGKSDQ